MRKALDRGKLEAVYDRVARRYDRQHALVTARSDQRGRAMLVKATVRPGDRVLDCGAGTGSTALLAALRTGSSGSVVLLDLSRGMSAVARKKTAEAGLESRVEYCTGDMLELPFAEDSFDVVLSTYSLCPLFDPARGAGELYRVVRPGGRVGIAHSTTPENPAMKWLAHKVEAIVWRIPALSLGCRPVNVDGALEQAGGRTLLRRQIGIPLWPFLVVVIEKPVTDPPSH